MKKGPLSKTDKDFIDKNLDMDIEALSKKLKRSESSIAKYTATLDKKTTTSKNNQDIDLFARKEDRGVVIMTEAASMSSDSSKSNGSSLNAKKYRNAIHKIREE